MSKPQPSPETFQHFDAALVIIGAGLSGVSALTVARRYLDEDDTIVIADQLSNYGGQWLNAYDFVRLHQPYEFYTAFDQGWAMKKKRTHLASRAEVLHHLRDLGERNHPRTLFEHRYIGNDEVKGSDLLDAKFQSVNDPSQYVIIRTPKIIRASPIKHVAPQSLQLSTKKVHSISIAQLTFELDKNIDSHMIVIGSGKSAMDAVLYINKRTNTAKRPITMVAGNGIAFFDRETIMPRTLLGRSFKGHPSLMLEYGLKWDGQNQAALMREMIDRRILNSPVPDPASCMFGNLGRDELETVQRSLGKIIKGRMSDIIDVNGIPMVRLEDGSTIVLDQYPGSKRIVVVNCTQHYANHGPAEPILQDRGRTLVSQLIFFCSSGSTAFLTHAWYLGKVEALLEKLMPVTVVTTPGEKEVLLFKLSLVGMYNLGILEQILPSFVLQKDKTNVLGWFPVHRRLMSTMKLRRSFPQIEEACYDLYGKKRYPKEGAVVPVPVPPEVFAKESKLT